MNNVTIKSALKVLALTTFSVIGLQGTAFATEAKHAASVPDVNYSVVKDAEKTKPVVPRYFLYKRASH
nr:hypothetical protein [Pseudomonas syringae]UVN18014.1 hypothetical protein pPsy0479b_00056 [Pseudomonas syringae]